jgi:D-tyrosyl-tRNA(Tyr) deacylase
VKAVVQRVRSAAVSVAGAEVARIGPGLLVLLGVAVGDGPADVSWMARNIAGLRIFADEGGKMNRSVAETGGSILAVSQFTLLGDCRAGRRPGFAAAAPPEEGRRLYEAFLAAVAAAGVPVRAGVFGADMLVALENDGPVTFILDTRG